MTPPEWLTQATDLITDRMTKKDSNPWQHQMARLIREMSGLADAKFWFTDWLLCFAKVGVEKAQPHTASLEMAIIPLLEDTRDYLQKPTEVIQQVLLASARYLHKELWPDEPVQPYIPTRAAVLFRAVMLVEAIAHDDIEQMISHAAATKHFQHEEGTPFYVAFSKVYDEIAVQLLNTLTIVKGDQNDSDSRI